MGNKMIKLVSGVIVEEQQKLTLAELCHHCGLTAEQLIDLIEQGLVEPFDPAVSKSRWHFSGDSVIRIQTALRLQRDLHVNLEGAVLAIELLDEIKELRQTVTYLKNH